MVGAHCKNHNRHSIGICYEGGLDVNGKPADTRTPEQKRAMRELLEKLKKDFPRALIVGHNTFSNKDCPCFDISEYNDLQPK
jgi:N-acetyl-anhydromuramyl-L-alanine amidase AmpD